MAMELLKRLAASRLPVTVQSDEDIDRVMILRAAGLVVTMTPEPSLRPGSSKLGEAIRVLAITRKGHEELARIADPGEGAPDAGSE